MGVDQVLDLRGIVVTAEIDQIAAFFGQILHRIPALVAVFLHLVPNQQIHSVLVRRCPDALVVGRIPARFIDIPQNYEPYPVFLFCPARAKRIPGKQIQNQCEDHKNRH